MKYRFNLTYADKIGATNRDYFGDLDYKEFKKASDKQAYEYALKVQAQIDKQIENDNVMTDHDVLLSACVERYNELTDEWEYIDL